MDIKQFLDSTYLKDNRDEAIKTIKDAIDYGFKLVMIKPEMVSDARKMINNAKSRVLIGTVIDFPKGQGSADDKVSEALQAVKNGADEIDYVSDYEAFKNGEIDKFVNDIIEGTRVGVNKGKVVKWIIETGALSKEEIKEITQTIRDAVQTTLPNFAENVFVKTSTGFYRGTGATPEDVAIMKQNSGRLPVKASGGVYSMDDAMDIINAGAIRIGTSRAVDIVEGNESDRVGY